MSTIPWPAAFPAYGAGSPGSPPSDCQVAQDDSKQATNGQLATLALFLLQRRQYLLWGDRQAGDPYTQRVVQGIYRGSRGGHLQALARLLGSKRALRVVALHHLCLKLWSIDCGRKPVR